MAEIDFRFYVCVSMNDKICFLGGMESVLTENVEEAERRMKGSSELPCKLLEIVAISFEVR